MAAYGVTDWMLLKLLFLHENWKYCAQVVEVYNSTGIKYIYLRTSAAFCGG